MVIRDDKTHTVGDLVDLIESDTDDCWFDILGDALGLDVAIMDQLLDSENFDTASELERAWICAHERKTIVVHWPEHVTVPRYNSDAFYALS